MSTKNSRKQTIEPRSRHRRKITSSDILLFTIDDHPDLKGMMCFKDINQGPFTVSDLERILGNRAKVIPAPRASLGVEDKMVEALAALIENERGGDADRADGDLKGDVQGDDSNRPGTSDGSRGTGRAAS